MSLQEFSHVLQFKSNKAKLNIFPMQQNNMIEYVSLISGLPVLNPSCVLSLSTTLSHVLLGCRLLRLPLGAHVLSAVLAFSSSDILKTWPNHFHHLYFT